jgi:hypothetical protein
LRWRDRLTILNSLLVAGTFLLLVGLYTAWWGAGSGTSLSRAAKEPLVPNTPILRDQQPLGAFAVVAGKNLFSEDRLGPNQGPAKSQDVLEGHQLLGIIIIGDTRAALIGSKAASRVKQEAEVEVVYLGEQWNGLKLVGISNESVVFQAKDGQKTLTFPE